jgi:glycosyltransferase involved in cell wall biosynthesis
VGAEPSGETLSRQQTVRVAIVCDLLEEQWPSMDLVGDMLSQQLSLDRPSQIAATQLHPPLRKRLSRLPGIGKGLGWNTDRLMNRFVDYPSWLRSKAHEFDLFHVVDHSYSQLLHALPPGRSVVTCHDLDTFRCVLEPERDRRPRWFRTMTQRILDGFKLATHVVAVSAATRDELLSYGLVPANRITVVSNGVHPSCSPAAHAPSDAAAARMLPALGEGPWLLNVGSTLPRKRLDVLLRVFASVRREVPGALLIRVGGLTDEHLRLAKELNIQESIVILPFLERDILAAVYRRATLLLHTAEAEGFGLPIVEAMACGCPVAASDLPVLREVGGSAASYCRVADVENWKETVVQLIAEQRQSASAWAVRRERSIAHAGKFSWAENASQTAAIYRKVMLSFGQKHADESSAAH